MFVFETSDKKLNQDKQAKQKAWEPRINKVSAAKGVKINTRRPHTTKIYYWQGSYPLTKHGWGIKKRHWVGHSISWRNLGWIIVKSRNLPPAYASQQETGLWNQNWSYIRHWKHYYHCVLSVYNCTMQKRIGKVIQ